MAHKSPLSRLSRLFRGSAGQEQPPADTLDEAPPSPGPAPDAETQAVPLPSRRRAAALVAPVFVIGYAPDAATLLTRCLIAHAGLAGHEQGMLLPLLLQLHRTVTQFFRTGLAAAGPDALIRHVDAQAFTPPIRRMFIDIMAAHHGSADWIDNTQGLAGIQLVPMLGTLWPRARFIFLASRVFETIAASPQPASLREQTVAWARGMQQWQDTRRKLAKSCVTLDRHELLSDPHAAAAELASFLQLDESQAAALSSALSDAVQAVRGTGRPLAASACTGWDSPDGEALRAASAPMMAAYGYSWDETYMAGTATRAETAV
jgi:hypothetical protein